MLTMNHPTSNVYPFMGYYSDIYNKLLSEEEIDFIEDLFSKQQIASGGGRQSHGNGAMAIAGAALTFFAAIIPR